MNHGRVFIDTFSNGLDELTVKQARCVDTVLRTLDRIKRFSAFEASANDTIARTMTEVFRKRYVKDLGGGYPWTKVEITPAGRAIIDAAIAKEPPQ
jgi:hypothetical protein